MHNVLFPTREPFPVLVRPTDVKRSESARSRLDQAFELLREQTIGDRIGSEPPAEDSEIDRRILDALMQHADRLHTAPSGWPARRSAPAVDRTLGE
jgi:hypothetical protein